VLLTGILSAILGVMMLAWPGKTLVAAGILFGAYLLVSGISQVFHAFTLHISGGGRALLFISGAASLVLAVLAFRNLADSILLLAIWAEAASAISDEDTPGRGWMIFLGVVTVLAGVIMLAFPFASLPTLLLVVGIWLIVVGILEIIAAFGIRKTGSEVRTVVRDALDAR